jgi:hypothetical protein
MVPASQVEVRLAPPGEVRRRSASRTTVMAIIAAAEH